MSTKVNKKVKGTASMRVRVKRVDGTVLDFGTASNIPIIGWFQQKLMNWRISNYRASLGLPRQPTVEELSGGKLP